MVNWSPVLYTPILILKLPVVGACGNVNNFSSNGQEPIDFIVFYQA